MRIPFRKGDRVVLNKNFLYSKEGEMGTVLINRGPHMIGVEMDRNCMGHNCDRLGRDDRCWWMYEVDLCPANETPFQLRVREYLNGARV